MKKILILLSVFLGEGVAIYAEMSSAKHSDQGMGFIPNFFQALVFIVVAGALLIAGYMYGLKVFQNIYIVSVMSITSILLLEPLLAYLIIHQLPTKGAVIGLILGAFGLFSALFIK